MINLKRTMWKYIEFITCYFFGKLATQAEANQVCIARSGNSTVLLMCWATMTVRCPHHPQILFLSSLIRFVCSTSIFSFITKWSLILEISLWAPLVVTWMTLTSNRSIGRPAIFVSCMDYKYSIFFLLSGSQEGQDQEPDARIAHSQIVLEHLCWWIWWQIDTSSQGVFW